MPTPGLPNCPICGYCLYGRQSPRCPECGTTDDEMRATIRRRGVAKADAQDYRASVIRKIIGFAGLAMWALGTIRAYSVSPEWFRCYYRSGDIWCFVVTFLMIASVVFLWARYYLQSFGPGSLLFLGIIWLAGSLLVGE